MRATQGLAGLILAGLAIAWTLPAASGSQSSNSSSNCSDGHCTVRESYREDDGSRRLGWESLRAWPLPGIPGVGRWQGDDDRPRSGRPARERRDDDRRRRGGDDDD